MSMTVEEASGKWCPMAKIYNAVCSCNRTNRGAAPQAARCLADNCMMWVEVRGYKGEQSGRCGLVRV